MPRCICVNLLQELHHKHTQFPFYGIKIPSMAQSEQRQQQKKNQHYAVFISIETKYCFGG